MMDYIVIPVILGIIIVPIVWLCDHREWREHEINMRKLDIEREKLRNSRHMGVK